MSLLGSLPSLLLAAPTATVGFNRDIRPILSDNCFACHGPDANQRKAKLRLDVRDDAVKSGAIVPGKPDESELVARIFTADEDDLMPPPESHKKLTAAEKDLLKRWVAEGAGYEPHWAYITPARPAAPKLKDKWARNAIDAFVLDELKRRDLKPSAEADKRTLLRRLSLDLIGLPPLPAEVESFVRDTSSRAYEKQVDRLLASRHFGERMAVPWLDVVRYADSVGYHGDQNQNIFPYRDYVIDAFNRNKPFDRFTIEQIAGDLLPNSTTEQKVATGFNRLNMMTREGGVQPPEYIAKSQADRVRAIGTAWLGSTLGCAECHDHKYDPFSTKDFYQISAFFADVKQWGYYADNTYTPNPDLRGFDNDHPFPPEIEVTSPALQRRIAALQAKIDEAHATADAKLKSDAEKQAAFEAWLQSSRAFLEQWPDGWAIPQPTVELKMKNTNAVAATNFTVQADNTVRFTKQGKETIRLKLPIAAGWVSAIRLEVVPEEGVSEGGYRKRFGTSVRLSASLKTAGKETKLPFHHAEADQKEDRYSNGSAIVGVTDVWQTKGDTNVQTAVWLLAKPVLANDGDELIVNLGAPLLDSARVSVSPFAAPEPLNSGMNAALLKAMNKPAFSRLRADRDRLAAAYLLGSHWDEAAASSVMKLQKDIYECRDGRAFTMVTESREPILTRVFPRGNWMDESGEVVQPAVPHFLPQPHAAETNRLTRLDLARWIVSRENPLTSRAVMNRMWKEFFGTGLSAVTDDLGAQGEPPSHPGLLDWLAVEFMESGWNYQHMAKLMVMSSTYRQLSNQQPEVRELDPNNRLLASQSPRRLEAEFVRDNALFIAGLLNPEIGGPSARPYQPPGYYSNLQFPNREYEPHTDNRQYRRGVYTHWQRTFLHPMLANFDAPSREECMARRVISNSPQQALTLLNDPSFVEASRVFAGKLLALAAKSDEARLEAAFQRALARPPKTSERDSLMRFLASQREHYQADADEAGKLMTVGIAPETKTAEETEMAAWTQVCRVILNLHETITRY